MNDINFMAIDPSKRSTGVFLKTQGQKHQVFTIKFNTKVPDNDLFKSLSYEIGNLVKDYKIDLIFIEDVPLGISRIHSVATKSLNEIHGIIKLAAFQNGARHIIQVNQSLWKGVLKGLPFLNQNKNKVYIRQASKILNNDFVSSDEVDAFCIAAAMQNLYKKQAFTDAQLKMKKKIVDICDTIKAEKIF